MTKKNEIQDAVLKDGKLFCSCGSELGNRDEYMEIAYNGKKYTQFIRFCKRKGCKIKSHYEIQLKIDSKNEVYIFPLRDCKKIKEEKIVFKEDE